MNDSTKDQLRLNALKDFYKMRSRWSKYILLIIYGLIIVYGLFVIGVGAGWLDFSKYPYILSIATGAVFICILGLAYIVFKFLLIR